MTKEQRLARMREVLKMIARQHSEMVTKIMIEEGRA